MIEIVFVSCANEEQAKNIAREVVEKRLAACAQVLQPMTSIYHWDGAVEESTEVPLVFKTTKDSLGPLQELVVSLHSYDVPEFVAIESSHCLPAYARWVVETTSESN
ncbi:MAG: divalent-cation tolerance protein CutA [Bdellovibrionales bacterium]|nr:divalent-cation tolerance protein CutA [Bdellovibrionales bacterium]